MVKLLPFKTLQLNENEKREHRKRQGLRDKVEHSEENLGLIRGRGTQRKKRLMEILRACTSYCHKIARVALENSCDGNLELVTVGTRCCPQIPPECFK